MNPFKLFPLRSATVVLTRISWKSPPHSGLRRDFVSDSDHLFVTVSVETSNAPSMFPTIGSVDCPHADFQKTVQLQTST